MAKVGDFVSATGKCDKAKAIAEDCGTPSSVDPYSALVIDR
jgi:hypothetical protein